MLVFMLAGAGLQRSWPGRIVHLGWLDATGTPSEQPDHRAVIGRTRPASTIPDLIGNL
jgi:hypothetical protein